MTCLMLESRCKIQEKVVAIQTPNFGCILWVVIIDENRMWLFTKKPRCCTDIHSQTLDSAGRLYFRQPPVFLCIPSQASLDIPGDRSGWPFSGPAGDGWLGSSQGSGWATWAHSQSGPQATCALCLLWIQGHCLIGRWTFTPAWVLWNIRSFEPVKNTPAESP